MASPVRPPNQRPPAYPPGDPRGEDAYLAGGGEPVDVQPPVVPPAGTGDSVTEYYRQAAEEAKQRAAIAAENARRATSPEGRAGWRAAQVQATVDLARSRTELENLQAAQPDVETKRALDIANAAYAASLAGLDLQQRTQLESLGIPIRGAVAATSKAEQDAALGSLNVEDKLAARSLLAQYNDLIDRKAHSAQGFVRSEPGAMPDSGSVGPLGTFDTPLFDPQRDQAALTSVIARLKGLGITVGDVKGAEPTGGGGYAGPTVTPGPADRFALTAAEQLANAQADRDAQAEIERAKIAANIERDNFEKELRTNLAQGTIDANQGIALFNERNAQIRDRVARLTDLAATATSDSSNRRTVAANLYQTTAQITERLMRTRVDPTQPYLGGRQPGSFFGGPQGTRTNPVFVDPQAIAEQALEMVGLPAAEKRAQGAVAAATSAAEGLGNVQEPPRTVITPRQAAGAA